MKPVIAEDIDMDEHVAEVVEAAMDELGARAGLWGVASESGLQLLLLGLLKAELDYRVLATVWDCRARDFTWAEIGELLGIAADAARARYDDSDPAEAELP